MKCKELLRIAACLEEHFPHSMAKAVVQAAVDRNLVHEELHSEVEYIVAHGISSMIENKKVVIGSYHFVFEDEQCTIPEGKEELFEKLPEECSHLYMAIEGKLAGVICIEDPLREEAKDVIDQSIKSCWNQESRYDDWRQRTYCKGGSKSSWCGCLLFGSSSGR